jgi:hypothetical protein
MSLTYPAGGLLDGTQSDFISFNHFEYSSNRKRGGSTPPSAGSIRLYMPTSTPSISNNQGWSEFQLPGPIGSLVGDIIDRGGSSLEKLGEQLGSGNFNPGQLGSKTIDDLKALAGRANDNIGGLANQVGADLAAGVLKASPNHLTALSQGKIFNPNTELLYDGPALRSFNLSFNFVPRNAGEARLVDDIILEFKKWSAPSIEDGGGMFKVPHIWSVAYSNGNKMNSFKPSALTSVSVQANPSTPMHVTYTDKTPIETAIGLSFQEVELITREDHEKVGGQGY